MQHSLSYSWLKKYSDPQTYLATEVEQNQSCHISTDRFKRLPDTSLTLKHENFILTGKTRASPWTIKMNTWHVKKHFTITESKYLVYSKKSVWKQAWLSLNCVVLMFGPKIPNQTQQWYKASTADMSSFCAHLMWHMCISCNTECRDICVI